MVEQEVFGSQQRFSKLASRKEKMEVQIADLKGKINDNWEVEKKILEEKVTNLKRKKVRSLLNSPWLSGSGIARMVVGVTFKYKTISAVSSHQEYLKLPGVWQVSRTGSW